jgi:Tfp pilus assembly protein PilN
VIDQLNLASQPFRNRTLPWTVAVTVACASVLALVFIISAGREAQARADRVEADVQELRQREQKIRTTAEAVESTLTPEQRLVLAAAHEIVDRKNFSWSRLLADLEATLPSGIRVARIAVRDTRQVNGQTRAEPGIEATLRVYYTPRGGALVRPDADATPARVATTTNARGAGETP